MDPFEHAAKRFSKEQSTYRKKVTSSSALRRQQQQQKNSSLTTSSASSSTANNNNNNNNKRLFISEKAKLEAEYNTQQQQQRLIEKQRQQQYYHNQLQYFNKWEESLGVRELTSSLASTASSGASASSETLLSSSSIQLKATSIYGDGDKIALPPSILEYLTSMSISTNNNNPWYFRIGIRNPNYTSFPSSPLLKSYQKLLDDDDDEDEDDTEFDDDTMDIDNNDTAKDNSLSSSKMYLDELQYKYLAYTYSTVIEFTQEEGCIGLPKSICDALLLQHHNESSTNDASSSLIIPTTRTIDPSKLNIMTDEIDNNNNDNNDSTNDDEKKTPGHVAYNVFDIPALPIDIQLIQYLPKGKSCTVIPTITAIQNGFYSLTDIKLVLEQSLIRTRGTLSKNDTISTWYRGKQYNLNVINVKPNTYNVISCINTDIEIEFDSNKEYTTTTTETTSSTTNSHSNTQRSSTPSSTSAYPSTGYVLGSSNVSGNADGNNVNPSNTITTMSSTTTSVTNSIPSESLSLLLPEPELDDNNRHHIVKIQIRYGSQTSTVRRFDINHATGYDLFAYAQYFLNNNSSPSEQQQHFQIVTRYPRHVYTKEIHDTMTLINMGIMSGQELLLIEYL